MTLTPSDRAALRASAEYAQRLSPGPYRIDWCDGPNGEGTGGEEDAGIDHIRDANGDPVVVGDSGVYPPHGRVASHIAGMSPDVTLRLLDALDAAEAELASAAVANLAFNVKAAKEINRARADRDAAHERMVGVLDSTFSVGDGTAQREIERLSAALEQCRAERDEADKVNATMREALSRFDAAVEARAASRTADIERQTAEAIASFLDGFEPSGVKNMTADTYSLLASDAIRASAWKPAASRGGENE